MIKFSTLDRSNINDSLANEEYDILIIGGGITGAGIALDASSRGLKVALIEKNDFSSGTSSKSTKLIHGGLRYLKQFDVMLVREVGSERAIVHKLAPHLVIPEKMLLPLIHGGTYGPIMSSIGLKVYDLLAGVKGDDRRKMLSKKQAKKTEPLLSEKLLKGAGYYAEYRTDDARLTIEVLKTALNYDTRALNYCRANDFSYVSGKVKGVKATDTITQKDIHIRAKYVINATGSWVDKLREINHSKKGKRLHLTKGVHLVFPHDKLPIKHTIYFDISDGRMMFAIPRGKTSYVGTTDTNYDGDINHVIVTKEDVDYLICAINNMFPGVALKSEDMLSSWAGIRSLIHEDGKSVSELSRKDEIFISDSELISIAGGKLTGFRKMAQRIINLVSTLHRKNEGQGFEKSITHNIPLSGGLFQNMEEVGRYKDQIANRLSALGIHKIDSSYLVHNYGKQSDIILDQFEKTMGDNTEDRLVKAELWFGVNYEMIQTPLDFFERRTGNLYFDIDRVKKLKRVILEEFIQIFNWNSETFSFYSHEIEAAIENVKP